MADAKVLYNHDSLGRSDTTLKDIRVVNGLLRDILYMTFFINTSEKFSCCDYINKEGDEWKKLQ